MTQEREIKLYSIGSIIVVLFFIFVGILTYDQLKERYKDYEYERQGASHVTTRDGVRYYLYRKENKAVVVPLQRKYKKFDIGNSGMYRTTKFYKGHVDIADTISYLFHKYPVTEVGKEAFANCNELESVQLPNTIEVIDEYAFSYCDKLKTINWPDRLRIIEKNAFYACSSLSEVELYGDCRILEDAFYGCESLERFIYKREQVVKPKPETDSSKKSAFEKSIAGGAFRQCNNLKHVEINAVNATFYTYSVNLIGDSFSPVFAGDTALKEIHISPACRNIFYHNGAVYDFNSLRLIFCLPTVDSIFYVPEGITGIYAYAFQEVPIKEVWLPKTTKYIGEHAFNDSTTIHMPRNANIEIKDTDFYKKQTIVHY